MQTAHYSALEAKHASLDAQIADQQGRPAPDHAAIADLKKRTLRIKEEMSTAGRPARLFREQESPAGPPGFFLKHFEKV